MKSKLIIGILLLAVCSWLLWRGVSPAPPDGAESVGVAEARYRIEGLKMIRTDAIGTPTLEVRATTAEYFDDGSAKLTTVEARGLTGEAAPWRLTSPNGSVPAGEKRLKLLTPVSGTGRWPDGEEFTLAAHDTWVDSDARRVSSSQLININGLTRNATAQGFSAPFDASHLQLDSVEMHYVLGK